MTKFSREFSAIAECLKKFASNNEEEENVEKLKFILNRGFR